MSLTVSRRCKTASWSVLSRSVSSFSCPSASTSLLKLLLVLLLRSIGQKRTFLAVFFFLAVLVLAAALPAQEAKEDEEEHVGTARVGFDDGIQTTLQKKKKKKRFLNSLNFFSDPLHPLAALVVVMDLENGIPQHLTHLVQMLNV